MHFLAVLNRDGGTLRGTDLDALAHTISSTLAGAGHTADIRIAGGAEAAAILKNAARETADVIIVGGGDGTVSTAAAALVGSGKTLAILPAGTMNLFARSLRIPLTLDAAIEALAHGEVRHVDIGSVDGRPFVHQFSIGLHARLVQLRSRLEYGSRAGKLWASVVAAFEAMRSPPVMRVVLDMGGAEVSAVTTGVGVSNNLFGEGHLPYADVPDGGILGIYVSSAMNRLEILWLFVTMALGRWQASQNIEIHQTESVTLKVAPGRRPHICVIDGELSALTPATTIRILPKALAVLAPRAEA